MDDDDGGFEDYENDDGNDSDSGQYQQEVPHHQVDTRPALPRLPVDDRSIDRSSRAPSPRSGRHRQATTRNPRAVPLHHPITHTHPTPRPPRPHLSRPSPLPSEPQDQFHPRQHRGRLSLADRSNPQYKNNHERSIMGEHHELCGCRKCAVVRPAIARLAPSLLAPARPIIARCRRHRRRRRRRLRRASALPLSPRAFDTSRPASAVAHAGRGRRRRRATARVRDPRVASQAPARER